MWTAYNGETTNNVKLAAYSCKMRDRYLALASSSPFMIHEYVSNSKIG